MEVHSTASIGISIHKKDGNTFQSLQRKANTAMRYIKKRGGNDFYFYNKDEMDMPSLKELVLINDLKDAINNKELVVYYQPLININTEKIICLEALIRWNHPKLGLISPNNFLHLAKSTGLISKIDEYVIKKVCSQLGKWNKEREEKLIVSVNISGRLFRKAEFPEIVKSSIEESGLKSEYLHLEITENDSIKDMKYAVKILNKIKELGVKICIDDFGTGYSSLRYLQYLPVDIMKIDKDFLINFDNYNRVITETIISLAQSLDIKTLSEGIEEPYHLKFLRDRGCDFGQGFLFYRPQPPEKIERIINRGE